MRSTLFPIGLAVTCSVLVAVLVSALIRPVVLTGSPSATLAASSITPAILTSGDAIVSKRPDLAIVSAGITSEASTAVAAQTNLASAAAKLISRIKTFGVPDADLSTSGYWIGPVYTPDGQGVKSYRASEELIAKWHNVDTVGKAVDAFVQEGGATNLAVSFALADPKGAEGEARTLAIADARARASAMASAAGVRLGQVLQVSDLSTNTRFPAPVSLGAAQAQTQIPVGQLDVQVTVEVDFAIA